MQKAINLALSAAVLLLGAGLVFSIVTRPEPASVDLAPEALGPLIEDYLLANPELLTRMSSALETERRAEESGRIRLALAELHDQIYNDPANIVLGNPEGDVTLVEMFDYNCGYCRQVVADVMSLVEEDPGLRVILKEFPILSQGSVNAARIGVLVNEAEDVDYRDFHTALYAARGSIDTEAALAAARDLGLNPLALELDMHTDAVTSVLQRNYTIAQALGVTGTPTFIIGDEIIPGALPKAELVRRIENMRACGAATCATPQEG